jgi:hypothetical protein
MGLILGAYTVVSFCPKDVLAFMEKKKIVSYN